MPTFANQIIEFYNTISLDIPLPEGVEVMHPHLRPDVASTFKTFYQKFYNDNRPRTFIIGINPGRFGGGVTGIPFTDPIKLKNYCGIDHPFENKTELSADFIYQVIERYGGPEKFYQQFYFTALSPLGFTYKGVNMNYYDQKQWAETLKPLMADWLKTQLDFGANLDRCICLGSGKNLTYLKQLNDQYGFFKRIDVLDHPRFIMQYRRKNLTEYLEQYVEVLNR